MSRVSAGIRTIGLVAVVLSGAACSAGDEQPATHDPAGVPIRRAATSPTFSVTGGPSPGGDSIFFYQVVHGAFVEEGVAISLASGGSRIIVLDPAGRVLRTLGPPGSGPGEFGGITGLHSAGERLLVWDSRNARVTTFGKDGTAEAFALRAPEALSVGVFDDGTLVTAPLPRPLTRTQTEDLVRTGARAALGEPRRLASWSPSGAAAGVILGAPERGPHYFSVDFLDGDRVVSSTFSPYAGCLPRPLEAVAGELLLVADPEAGSVFAIDRENNRKLLASSFRRNPVTEEAVTSVERWMERTAVSMNGRGMRGPTEQSRSETLERAGRVGEPLRSVWSRLLVNRGAHEVWLLRATCNSESPVDVWDIVSIDGGTTATAELPSNLRVLAVDGDRVLGIQKDALGVESVVVLVVEGA